MKALFIIWLCFLTLYAPLELSRLIFAYGLDFTRIFELCVIWIFYLAFVVILTKIVRFRRGTRTP